MTDYEFVVKVEEYKNMIFRLAMSYLKNTQEAEDVMQNVFIKFYINKKVFQTVEDET